jgi:pimeloyl-ACP methyl ester carboxylesterase
MPGEFAARVPGGSITGWLAGTGPPVLVLHGGPGLSDYTAPLAAELTDAFGVIRYQIEDCGHFPWLERPGSVRAALDRICA